MPSRSLVGLSRFSIWALATGNTVCLDGLAQLFVGSLLLDLPFGLLHVFVFVEAGASVAIDIGNVLLSSDSRG